MARMTADDFVAFTRKGMGNPTDTQWTDAELLRLANLAQNRVAMTYLPKELETTVDITTASGTASYEVGSGGSDLMHVTSIMDTTTGIRLKPTTRDRYTRETQGSSGAPQGTIYRYLESGEGSNNRRQFIFQLTPNSANTIRIWYIPIPTAMVLSPTATSSTLNERWDEYILKAAIEIGLELDNQRIEASKSRQMAGEVEQRAGVAKPKSSEDRAQVHSVVGDAVKGRSNTNYGRGRSRA